MAITNILKSIILDVYDHDKTPKTIKSIAADNDIRYIAAEIQSEGVRYDVSASSTVELIILRPDKVGVSVIGQAQEFTYETDPVFDPDTGETTPGETITYYGVYAELDQAALAKSGVLLGQFKITNGEQVLRTEIFKVNNGRALDAETSEWAGEYQGYDLEEIVTKVDDMEEDVAKLKSGLSNIDERVSELEDSTITTLLGNTPFTLTEDADIKLTSNGQVEYTLSGLFLADYNSPTTDDVEVRTNNATIANEGGKMIFTATGDDPNTCWVDLRLNNLTVGDTYTLTITRGEYVSGTTGGHFVIYDRNGEVLANSGDIAEDEVTVDFVATTPFARVRLYPSTSYFWETYGIKTATIVNAVVTSQRSGTFNNSTRLGILESGIIISSSPICQVYSVTEDTGADDALSTTSRNPVQNRIITAAIGQLSDLNTTAKSNLVEAINEAATSSESRLNGKRCVFLGDSVAAYRTPPQDIPSIVGSQTGMITYNCAFGGCGIADRTVASGDTDPWEAFCMVRLVDSIVSGDWAYQDANIQSLADQDSTGYSPTDHYATLKAINWSNVDYCVVFFAGNDPGNVRFDDPNNSENTFYYLGAFRYSIKKLLTAYPHLKLLVVGTDYHKTGGSNTDERTYTIDGQTYYYYEWSDRLMAECKNLKIPTLDWYRSSGLNALTVDYYMSSDGKHPNYIGNQLLAGQIAAKLLSQY